MECLIIEGRVTVRENSVGHTDTPRHSRVRD